MDLHVHGARKFPNAGLIASSRARGWNDIAAELRAHPAGDLPAIIPAQMELTLAVRGNQQATVSRKGDGVRQETAVAEGTIWLCPVGVGEDDVRISGPLDEILHIYLPVTQFEALSEQYGDRRIRADAVQYLAAVDDPLIRHLGLCIRSELLEESSAGRMMVESAGLALTARVSQSYAQARPSRLAGDRGAGCPARIWRAIEFIRDNLDRDISVADLAAVACLSPFHFARMFKRVTGTTPHGFVSAERLASARRLLADRDVTLVSVALRTGFSSQSSFNTAFRRAMGCTPGNYRKQLS